MNRIVTILQGMRKHLESGTHAAQTLEPYFQSLAEALAEERLFNDEMARITEKINAGLTFEEILAALYGAMRSVLPYDRIGCALLDDNGTVLRSRWNRASYEPIHLKGDFSGRMQNSSLARILETGEPRILNDLEAYLIDHPESVSTRLIVEEGIRSSLTCPLVARNRPVGFLFFSSRSIGTYRDAHVDLYRRIAGQVSLTLEKSRLYDRVVELNDLKNRFLGMASHDLRNPLFVIVGYLSLFQRGKFGPPSPEAVPVLEMMMKSCESMIEMIDNLLDVNIIESGRLELNLEEVPLEPFLREKCAGGEILARSKSIVIETALPAELPAVRLDRSRMAQVIDNLVSNAVKYSHPGTKITVAAAATGGEAEIRVRDEGQGIPLEEQEKLFKHFGKTSVKATAGERSIGLGLAIIKNIVDAHGGRIRVESRPGEGSTFIVTLPVGGPALGAGKGETR